MFSSLFDGTTDEVHFDGHTSFMEGVKKLVEGAPVPPGTLSETTVEDEASEGSVALLSDLTVQATSTAEAVAPIEAVEMPTHALTPLFAGVSLSRLPNGGVRIDAPPELAAPLASFFESLARSLREGAAPGTGS